MEPAPYEFIPLFGMMFSFVAAITIVIVVARAKTRRLQIQAELQAKLIEKFGSTPELIAFLQSEAGRAFVSGHSTRKARPIAENMMPPRTPAAARSRVMRFGPL